ncbi:MAG: hypothetical protein IPK19_13120 [Chloroflexi bacterium]|nr:hypothetical protein [Chloroflexota bacterium]
MIHRAGGVAVFAHPGLVPEWQTILAKLVAAGLDGVEVNHLSNNEAARLELRALAAKYGLIMTGGSDFHGPVIKPGNSLGCISPPEGAVYALHERARRYAKSSP